ncbi:MAG: patatin-like phospholipase family protein, partial [Christensenellales bacterium]
LFSGKGVMKIINQFIPDVKIESLDKTFACVASDLIAEKEVVLKTGSLRDAVRATMSIPGFFVPFNKDGRILVDGGILNNLPEDVAVELGADIIISCDVLTKCKITKRPKNAFETLMYSVNMSTKEIQKLKAYHSDILIQPDMTGLGQLVFTKKKTLLAIKRGEEETEKYIKKIQKLIND